MTYNKLTNAEAERLAILAEECGEVVYIVGKILRHGYDSHNPVNDTGTNRFLLEKELGDMANIIDMMVKAGDIDVQHIEDHQDEKFMTVQQYLHYN